MSQFSAQEVKDRSMSIKTITTTYAVELMVLLSVLFHNDHDCVDSLWL